MGTKLGGAKGAATKLGVGIDEYLQKTESGLHRCCLCFSWLPFSSFSRGNSVGNTYNRCRDCTKKANKDRYCQVSGNKERKKPGRHRKEPRDGDKNQAKKSVHYATWCGELPRPQGLACTDCGHIGSDLRHEYDHYLGYDAINHLNVQCVCQPCHRNREQQRRVEEEV